MTDLYLVRHGETLWNREMRWQGQLNAPLSPLGLLQAARLADRLSSIQPCPVWSSDLQRALDTALHLRTSSQNVQTHEGLREVLMGAWQGLTHREVAERYPETLKHYFSDFEQGKAPGGESFGEMARRLRMALTAIAKDVGDAPCIVVAHGGPIKAAVCHVTGIPLGQRWRFAIDNASITRIRWAKDSPRLLFLNDTCHLAPSDRPPHGI